MRSKKIFAAALIFLTLIFFLFSCRNISPDDLQKDDLKQIKDFLFEDKNKTESYIELTYETASGEVSSPVTTEIVITQDYGIDDYILSPEDTDTALISQETTEETAAESSTEIILTPNERVINEFPDIPEQFSYIPLPDSLSFTDGIKNMISNLNGLAKRDFNTQRVYIAASKPELLTPNLQNNKYVDTKHYRNKLIEQKYNINLSSLYIKNEDRSMYSDISKSIDSGEYFSDILCLPMSETLKLMYTGRLYNMRKTPFINFNAQYYNQSLISDSQIKNSLYMISSDFTFDPSELYAIYFNRDLCKEKNINVTQYAGNWSLDNFLIILRELSYDINVDESDDALISSEEFFAADFTDDNILRSLFTSGGIKYYTPTDTYPSLNFNSEEDYGIIEKLKSLFQVYIQEYIRSEEEASPVEKFTSGNALFLISTLEQINEFTTLPFDWTLLPFPASDSDSENNFKGYPSQDSLVISIPASVANTELCGIIIESLSISSHNLLKEEYVTEKMTYNLRDIASVKTLKEIIALNNINYTNTFPLNQPPFGSSDNIYDATTGYIKNIITGDVDYSDFTNGFDKSQSLLNEFFNTIGKNNNIY